jgi:serine phosphatase RsbU (regulator of sigma subunit)
MFWRSKKPSEKPGAEPGGAKRPASSGAKSSVGSKAADDATVHSGDDDTGTRFLTGDGDIDRRTVDVLLSTIRRVSESRDLEALLIDIVDRSVELCGAERGFLLLVDASGEPAVRVARTRDGKAVEENVRFSTSVVKRVIEKQQPMLATVQSDSDALELGRSVFDLKLRAVMCVPLTPRKDGLVGARGALYVDSRAATREFAPKDLDLFAALSQHIAIALEKAQMHLESVEKAKLEQALELASAVQSGLMPRIPTDIPGLELHGFYRPAERTSGDFFDFVKLKDGRLAVVIGDVSGHGVGPALVTATAQATLRTGLKMMPTPAAALTFLNQDLSERIDSGTFLTLLLLTLKSDGWLEICNAGHHAAILVRRGEVISPQGHSLALGFSPESQYDIDEILKLESGDVLVAFTDGLIETQAKDDHDKLFGEDRLRELLVELAAKGVSAEEITRSLAQAAFEFGGGVHEDDITLVVVRKL